MNVKIPPLSIVLVFSFFYEHIIKYHLLNMLEIRCDINQQDFIIADLHFVKSLIINNLVKTNISLKQILVHLFSSACIKWFEICAFMLGQFLCNTTFKF